jgi:hypothetical protein
MKSQELADEGGPGGVWRRIPFTPHLIRAIYGLFLNARRWPDLNCASVAGFRVRI